MNAAPIQHIGKLLVLWRPQPDKEKSPKEEKQAEKLWRNKADKQKDYFDSLPPVRIMIPCEGEEKPGVVREEMVYTTINEKEGI